jgi:hypothetical protein
MTAWSIPTRFAKAAMLTFPTLDVADTAFWTFSIGPPAALADAAAAVVTFPCGLKGNLCSKK